MKELSKQQIEESLSNLCLMRLVNRLNQQIATDEFKKAINVIPEITSLLKYLRKNNLITRKKAFNIFSHLLDNSSIDLHCFFLESITYNSDHYLDMLEILPFSTIDTGIYSAYDFWILYKELRGEFLEASPIHFHYSDYLENNESFDSFQEKQLIYFLDKIMPHSNYFLNYSNISSPIIDNLIDKHPSNKEKLLTLIETVIDISNSNYKGDLCLKIVDDSYRIHENKSTKYSIIAIYSYDMGGDCDDYLPNDIIITKIKEIVNILDTLVLPEIKLLEA